VEPPDDRFDRESVYSERTDLSSADHFISKIARILLQQLKSERADVSALDQIQVGLEQWLRAFAIQLGHEVKSQEALYAMVFIRRYRR
jgi:hypothetical protein